MCSQTFRKWSTTYVNRVHVVCCLREIRSKRSFVSHLEYQGTLVSAFQTKTYWSIFCNFQNACPRKCSGHFLTNCTQLNYLGYYKLVEYQLLYSFIHHLLWRVNMVENSKFAQLWETSIFGKFQHASLRNFRGHFSRHFTQLHRPTILQAFSESAKTSVEYISGNFSSIAALYHHKFNILYISQNAANVLGKATSTKNFLVKA